MASGYQDGKHRSRYLNLKQHIINDLEATTSFIIILPNSSVSGKWKKSVLLSVKWLNIACSFSCTSPTDINKT